MWVTVEPRSLSRFQQLNSVKLSGVGFRPLDESLRFFETEAAKILPKGYTVDYTGESRQLRTEGNKFLPAFLLAVILIFLVLAAQFNSFRDPFVILAGSVPLAMFGALLMTFLKMPNPNLHFMLSGHIHDESRRADVAHGHPVHQVLADYQDRMPTGGEGWLRTMRFVPGDDTVYRS